MGRTIANDIRVAIGRMIRDGASDTDIRAELGSSRNTIAKERVRLGIPNPRNGPATLPAAKHETTGPNLPDAVAEDFSPFKIDCAGVWLILSDIHAPYHDRTTLELAVTEARRRGVAGILLNGDTLDSHEISRHDKDPSAPRYIEEIETGKKLVAWLRGRFPDARIVAKEGNHEERLGAYIMGRAPALQGLEGVDFPSLLHFAKHGVEWVANRRVIALGRLNVLHGHEYPGGANSPVNPARGLYLKARSVALCGHHHQTSEHHARNVRGRPEAAWSLGCCCFLYPRYMPLNNWNHGFAFVTLDASGEFAVENKRVFSGKIV